MKLRLVKQFLNNLSDEAWGDAEVLVNGGGEIVQCAVEDVRKEETSSALSPNTKKYIVIRY